MFLRSVMVTRDGLAVEHLSISRSMKKAHSPFRNAGPELDEAPGAMEWQRETSDVAVR